MVKESQRAAVVRDPRGDGAWTGADGAGTGRDGGGRAGLSADNRTDDTDRRANRHADRCAMPRDGRWRCAVRGKNWIVGG